VGGQRKTLILPRLEYIALLSRQTNNTELKSMIGFNALVDNNPVDCLSVNIAYLFVAKKGNSIKRKMS